MELRGKTIAVTGATGFVGRHIAETLLERGAHVIGVVRNPDRVPALLERGVQMRRADLADPDALREAMTGTDALVSNAALLSLRRFDWNDYLQTNVRGTENALGAAAAAGVQRVIQISSVASYRGHTQPLTDEDQPQLDGTARPGPLRVYALSKALSEQRAWQLAAAHGLSLTALRPCGIYGPFDQTIMPVLRRATRSPFIPSMARLGFVYVRDVAEAVALALEKPISVGRAYNITGGDETLWSFMRALNQAQGRRWLRIPLPVPVRRLFDSSRARRELGWSCRPFAEALRETVQRGDDHP